MVHLPIKCLIILKINLQIVQPPKHYTMLLNPTTAYIVDNQIERRQSYCHY